MPQALQPTAHTGPGRALTPLSPAALPVGLGLRWVAHLDPFQCRISVLPSLVLVNRLPTAHAFPAVAAATPARLAYGPGLGEATRFHDRPSQCSIKVAVPAVP